MAKTKTPPRQRQNYTREFRDEVVAAHLAAAYGDKGTVAIKYGVPFPTLVRWARQAREGGADTVEAAPEATPAVSRNAKRRPAADSNHLDVLRGRREHHASMVQKYDALIALEQDL